jgi:hypothetical protein
MHQLNVAHNIVKSVKSYFFHTRDVEKKGMPYEKCRVT